VSRGVRAGCLRGGLRGPRAERLAWQGTELAEGPAIEKAALPPTVPTWHR
jgi:hypothetical protein